MRGERTERTADDRAQTGIDFLVGATIFLIAVGFVFSFLPTMFDPFGGPTVNNALIADRSAAYLAEYALVEDPSNPGVLSVACTAAFFDEEDALGDREEIADDCNFDSDRIDDLTGLLGLQDWKNVQITIGEPTAVDWEGETIELQRGDGPSSGSDTVSQRVVSIDGGAYELRVRVW